MSEAELRAYSERYRQLQIRDSDEPELLLAWKGNTQILLWLDAGRLAAYQVTWTYPLTNFDSRLKTDLCSGVRYVDVSLVGDPELSGAAVWLDGQRVGELSSSGNLTWYVPLGAHQLRVEEPDGGAWSIELRYDDSSSGHDSVAISHDALRPGSPSNAGME